MVGEESTGTNSMVARIGGYRRARNNGRWWEKTGGFFCPSAITSGDKWGLIAY
jgi:hypothetical protein